MKPMLCALGLLIATSAAAQAQNYPWCAQYGNGTGGGRNCGFTSFRQCMADVSGIGGFCERNNTYAPIGRHRHRYPQS